VSTYTGSLTFVLGHECIGYLHQQFVLTEVVRQLRSISPGRQQFYKSYDLADDDSIPAVLEKAFLKKVLKCVLDH